MSRSMTDIAFQVMEEHRSSMPFVQLWTTVSKELGFNETQFEDNIAQFYTDLSMDGRFLSMPQNTWDLRSRHTYSETVMDTDSISLEEEDEDDEDLELVDEEQTSKENQENEE